MHHCVQGLPEGNGKGSLMKRTDRQNADAPAAEQEIQYQNGFESEGLDETFTSCRPTLGSADAC